MTARLLGMAFALLLVSAFAASAQEVKLRATIQVALTERLWGVALARFKDEVEKRSEKAVSIEVFDNGKLYIDDQAVDAVASGAIEMGVAGLYQMAKKIPAIDIMEQPFLFNFDALIRAAVSPNSEIRKIIDAVILEKLGLRILWWQSLGNQIIVSKGRDLTDPQQIKGQRIRVFGETTADLARRCGGVPVILSAFKMQEAMRDNELDMVMCSIPAVPNRELWKVGDTITRTWHAPVEYVAFINEKAWASMSPTQQIVFIEVARSVECLSSLFRLTHGFQALTAPVLGQRVARIDVRGLDKGVECHGQIALSDLVLGLPQQAVARFSLACRDIVPADRMQWALVTEITG